MNCYEFCRKYDLHSLLPFYVRFYDKNNPLKSDKGAVKGFTWDKAFSPDSEMAKIYKDFSLFGILTEPNNLVVIDCDIDKNQYSDNRLNAHYGEQIGLNNLKAFIKENMKTPIEQLLDTLTVKTHTGGYHFFFRLSDSQTEQIQSNADKFLHKVDIRAKGGLLICPCSRLWNPYLNEWREYRPNDKEIKVLPDELYKALPKVKVYKRAQRRDLDFDMEIQEYNLNADTYLKKQLEKVTGAGEGNRNNTLSSISGQAFRLCPQYFSFSFIEDLCFKVGARLGLSDREITATINSAKRYGEENPLYF